MITNPPPPVYSHYSDEDLLRLDPTNALERELILRFTRSLDELSELEAKIEDLDFEISGLGDKVDELNSEVLDLVCKIDDLELQVSQGLESDSA